LSRDVWPCGLPLAASFARERPRRQFEIERPECEWPRAADAAANMNPAQARHRAPGIESRCSRSIARESSPARPETCRCFFGRRTFESRNGWPAVLSSRRERRQARTEDRAWECCGPRNFICRPTRRPFRFTFRRRNRADRLDTHGRLAPVVVIRPRRRRPIPAFAPAKCPPGMCPCLLTGLSI